MDSRRRSCSALLQDHPQLPRRRWSWRPATKWCAARRSISKATKDATLWKLELLLESGQGGSHVAWVGGFEYTWYGINESDSDLGLLVEHLFDGRGGRAPHPLENDLFAGVRLALNDEAGTDLVAAIIADAEGDGTAVTVEASRRIGDDWKVELEARAWNGVEDDDQLAPLRRDDYVQLTLSRFF